MIDNEKLNALVDNELDPATRAEVEALLAQDPNTAAHVGSIKAIKSALQDHVQPVKCDDEWKACVKRLNEIDKSRKTKFVIDRYAWAMCSVLFIFIFAAGMLNRSNPGLHTTTGELSRAGMEKPVRDVYHWLKSELGVTPVVQQRDLTVVGASQGTESGHVVASIHLRDDKGDMNLTVVGPQMDPKLPSDIWAEGVTPMGDGVHYSCQTGEATSVVWKDRGIVMMLTAKRDAEELRDISNSISWQRQSQP